MFNLSENYHLRKCFLQREQVPTQSMMKKKMSPRLAAIYFESMTPKLKVLAGLEPSFKGGGNVWYVPPKELLEGRAVLKPVRKEILAKLNHSGIEHFGTTLFQKHRKAMDIVVEKALIESDVNWRNNVKDKYNQEWEYLAAVASNNNTEYMRDEFRYFAYLYRQSLGKIEALCHESAVAEIKNTREKAQREMQNKYTALLNYQATMLYEAYEKKLMEGKARLKAEFIQDIEIARTTMADKIHDVHVDKHLAIEKLRQCLECQNLACEIYVALKEREECLKETEELKREHQKKVDFMTYTQMNQDTTIYLAKQKEKKRQIFCNIWKKKVCHVVKTFQTFVSHCLDMFPEHAEFFINIEKLLLLQVNESLQDPTAESIIEVEHEQFHTPVPRPKPFYLFCDRGYKGQVDQDLCPKHSGTSSNDSYLPVIIVNKRCLYAACDNFEQFTNKIKHYIHGNRGDDVDVRDDLTYEHFVPVKYTLSQQLSELKLESSLLQVLQQEIAYLETCKNKDLIKSTYCDLPRCSCTPAASIPAGGSDKISSSSMASSRTLSYEIPLTDRNMILDHEREPKWDSFFTHVKPKKCSCAKTAKKHLFENLPVYMRHMKYGPPDIPDYEMCSITTLKALVKQSRKESTSISPVSSPSPIQVISKTKDMSTQYSDLEFENLCTCFDDDELNRTSAKINLAGTVIGTGISLSYMTQRTSSFATSRAISLRNLVKDMPDLQDIFMKNDCDFE